MSFIRRLNSVLQNNFIAKTIAYTLGILIFYVIFEEYKIYKANKTVSRIFSEIKEVKARENIMKNVNDSTIIFIYKLKELEKEKDIYCDSIREKNNEYHTTVEFCPTE